MSKSIPAKASSLGFWALVLTVFQGAFNDNAFKTIVIFLLPALLADKDFAVTALASFLFTIPFLLFPAYAGYLADRFSKQLVTVWTKYWEFLVMLMGLAAFYRGNPMLIWCALFLMSMQSAFFSPSKYGILPEILEEKQLSWGNGIIQMATMLAIILGTAVATPLMGLFKERIYLTSVALVAFTFVGLISSHFITKAKVASPDCPVPWNPYAGMGRYFKCFLADRWLFLTMLGIAYFWFSGSLVMMNIVELAKETVNSEALKGQLLTALSLGIGIGSVMTGYLSRGKIEVGLIPLGGFGLAVFSAVLGIPGWGFAANLALLFFLGFFGGFFDIPLAATLQQRSPADIRGGMIATSNFVTFAAMALSTGLFYLLFNQWGLKPNHIFLVNAVLTFGVTIYICAILPIFLLRFLLWCFTSAFYRIRVLGRENIPEKGGALFVANHTSFVDALIILASTDRQVRFIMYKGIYDHPMIKPLAKIMGAIPIAAEQGPREMIQSMRTATEALKEGEVVCIFAEGQITRTGQLLPFRKGLERIVKDTDAPIIPIHLDNLWGSIFSYAGGRFFWKIPAKLPHRVTVNYGAPLAPATAAAAVRAAIQELGVEAFAARRFGLLHRDFARQVRRHPFKQAVADGLTERMSYFKALVGSLVLAGKLREAFSGDAMMGLLLPPSVPGALANIAAQWLGKPPVNLNYTASAEALDSACTQCDITSVLTARAFLEKAKIEAPRPPICIEEVLASVTIADRIVAILWAAFLPCRVIEWLLGAPRRTEDSLAAVLFSSGSEGAPKGVMLTHRNIAANIESTLQVFPHEKTDRFMGILPLFHAIGFTATLWMPLTSGLSVVFHPNPLESRVVGALIYKHRATFLMATSTLLQGFIRRCAPEQLSSLKYIVCGAEKLAPAVREACKETFGIEPIEGYGATECAPMVTLNVPNFRVPGFFQRGTKPGTIGHPIPGVSIRILDPDSGAARGPGEPGMLLVKGPNVMPGYLKNPEKTSAVLREGWYETGDIASVDEEGFIALTGRLSRFSKIAGEMVPHGTVEEMLHELLGLSETALAVVGLPDEKKGERLVVLHTLEAGQLAELQEKLKRSELPNLWRPANNAFFAIDAIPVLGTGKVNLRALKEQAAALAGGEGGA